jgi:acetyl esterase
MQGVSSDRVRLVRRNNHRWFSSRIAFNLNQVKCESFQENNMRRPIIIFLAALAAIAASFFVMPWPGVYIIRYIFDQGAAEAAAKLMPLVPGSVQKTTVAYDEGNNDAMLDIYRLPDADVALPTVVWIHGGGFVSGRRGDIENYLKVLAGEGFTVVNVDYTIAPSASYPTPVRQVNRALAFLTREAAGLGINARRFVLAGDSAGAQIAAQTVAIIANPAYGELVGVTAGAGPEQIAGALLFCGVYDIAGLGNGGGILGWFVHVTAWAYSGERNWRESATFATMSLTPHLTADFPPAFISAGNADPLAPQSAGLADVLTAKGVEVETLFFPPDYSPALAHEYQFDLGQKAGQMALSQAADWMRGLSQTP